MDDKNKIDGINKMLKDTFGVDDKFRPIFRVVWSDSQIEKRWGTFTEMYGSIFIRETKGLVEAKKYNYIAHRWVLEKLMPAMTDEVIGLDNDRYSYEPIYTFEDKFQRPLPVEWWACEMIVRRLLGAMSGEHRRTQSDVDAEEDAAYAKEVAYMEDVIADAQGGDVAVKLNAREGIVVPGRSW